MFHLFFRSCWWCKIVHITLLWIHSFWVSQMQISNQKFLRDVKLFSILFVHLIWLLNTVFLFVSSLGMKLLFHQFWSIWRLMNFFQYLFRVILPVLVYVERRKKWRIFEAKKLMVNVRPIFDRILAIFFFTIQRFYFISFGTYWRIGRTEDWIFQGCKI